MNSSLPKLVRKSKYRIVFRSDWKYEFESFRKSLRIKRLRILYCILGLLFTFAVAVVIYVYVYSLHNYYLAIFWFLYSIVLALLNFIIIPLKPKTYETSLRGLKIDENLYLWKNFRGYVTSDDRIYLFRSSISVVCLPRDFEEIVKEFVPCQS